MKNKKKLLIITCILVSDYLEVVMFYKLFRSFKKWKKISKHKFEVRTVLLEVGVVLGILKKSYLKLTILF